MGERANDALPARVDVDTAEIRVHVSVVVMRGDRLLLVQEGKPNSRGKWNLPGGHLEHRERFVDGGRREAKEETGLDVEITALLGLYTGMLNDQIHSVRAVLRARALDPQAEPIAGDQILAVRWATVADVLETPDDELLAPPMLRAIVRDVAAEQAFPLAVLGEVVDA